MPKPDFAISLQVQIKIHKKKKIEIW